MTQPSDEAMIEEVAQAIATSRGSNVVQWFHRNDARAAAAVIQSALAAQAEEIAKWLERDASQCDCFAREANECACGAWDDYKRVSPRDLAQALRSGAWKD